MEWTTFLVAFRLWAWSNPRNCYQFVLAAWRYSRSIHPLSRHGWISIAAIFLRTVEWSSWSKALLWLTTLCHICVISIRACVVKWPRSAPDCLGLQFLHNFRKYRSDDQRFKYFAQCWSKRNRLQIVLDGFWRTRVRYRHNVCFIPETWHTSRTTEILLILPDWRIDYVFREGKWKIS